MFSRSRLLMSLKSNCRVKMLTVRLRQTVDVRKIEDWNDCRSGVEVDTMSPGHAKTWYM